MPKHEKPTREQMEAARKNLPDLMQKIFELIGPMDPLEDINNEE